MQSLPPFARQPRIGDGKFSFIPNDTDHQGWLLLSEAPRLISVTMYPLLFKKFGTFYGGNGTTTFALPPAGGRFFRASASNTVVGALGGAKEARLETKHLPAHTHGVSSVTTANTPSQLALLTGVGLGPITKPPTTTVTANAAVTSATGNNEPFSIEPPFIVVNVFIYAGSPVIT